MKKPFFCCILVLIFGLTARAQMPWSTTASGCEVLDGSFQDADRHVSFVLVRCDPTHSEIRLIDTSSELGRENGYAAFSLREVMTKTRSAVVVNAGSTRSFSAPIPAGLLEVGGAIVSPPKFYVKNAAVLCINRDRVSIVKLLSKIPKDCPEAVQRGPFLSWELVSANDDSGHHRRTVAAVDKQGRLLILVTKEGATLSSVVSFLYGSKPDLGVLSALNLDGDASSGLIFAGSEGIKEPTVGSVDGLVASAIAIRRRR